MLTLRESKYIFTSNRQSSTKIKQASIDMSGIEIFVVKHLAFFLGKTAWCRRFGLLCKTVSYLSAWVENH